MNSKRYLRNTTAISLVFWMTGRAFDEEAERATETIRDVIAWADNEMQRLHALRTAPAES